MGRITSAEILNMPGVHSMVLSGSLRRTLCHPFCLSCDKAARVAASCLKSWPLAAGVCEDSSADGIMPGPCDQLWGEQHLPCLPATGEILYGHCAEVRLTASCAEVHLVAPSMHGVRKYAVLQKHALCLAHPCRGSHASHQAGQK